MDPPNRRIGSQANSQPGGQRRGDNPLLLHNEKITSGPETLAERRPRLSKVGKEPSFRAEIMPDTQHAEPPSRGAHDDRDEHFKGGMQEHTMNKRSRFQKDAKSNKMGGSFARMTPDTPFPGNNSLRRIDLETVKQDERLERERVRNTSIEDLDDRRRFRRTQYVTGVMPEQLPDVSPTWEPEDGRRGQREPDARYYSVHSNFASNEKMPSKMSLRSRTGKSQSEKGSGEIQVGALPGQLRKGRRRPRIPRSEDDCWGDEGPSDAPTISQAQQFRDEFQRQHEAGLQASMEEVVPGAWRWDDGEAEHLAPHPGLARMLGSSSDFNNSLTQILQQEETDGIGDEEEQEGAAAEQGTSSSLEVKEVGSKRQRWIYRLLAFALVLIAAVVVAVLVVTSRENASPTPPMQGNATEESTSPSSSPSQDPLSYDGAEWMQLGQVLRGAQENDHFGRTLAISSGGSIVAASTNVSTVSSNETGRRQGYVRVYQLEDTQWVQLGDDFITADVAYVDLAKNGTVLSIATIGREDGTTSGSVQLFDWSSAGGWRQLGNTIEAPKVSSSRYFGYETKLSEDGSVVIVGDPGAGVVLVFSISAGNWTQFDGDPLIFGTTTGFTTAFHRSTLSISGDGAVVAIGAWDNEIEQPLVRVYEQKWGRWEKQGKDIDKDMIESNSNENIGQAENRVAVSLSFDGNIVAVGDGRSFTTAKEGIVQVLHYNGDNWDVFGQHLSGTVESGFFGTSISLSADGSTFAAGTPFRMPRESSQAIGRSEVYHLSSGNWGRVGKTLQTDVSSGAAFGSYIALASDGMTVAIADEYSRGNGERSGSVTVFRLASAGEAP